MLVGDRGMGRGVRRNAMLGAGAGKSLGEAATSGIEDAAMSRAATKGNESLGEAATSRAATKGNEEASVSWTPGDDQSLVFFFLVAGL